MRKTIVIGLDGANWDLLDPWVQNGELPNLRTLKENGVFGVSKSCLPPVTCPNWKCYSTGKNPGKLGVYWWEAIDFKKRKTAIADSKSFKSKEIWDYMGDQGIGVGIVNMPTTYPPKKVNGFLIAGGPTCKEKGYTYPRCLEDYLKKKYNYRVNPQTWFSTKEDANEWIDEILELIDIRFKVASDLLNEKINFLHVTIFYINVLQHFFYNKKPVKKGWKLIDKNIGDFIKNCKDCNIILMSDHGCDKVDTFFYINNWLGKQGYLKLKKNITYLLIKSGINLDRLRRIAKNLGLPKRIVYNLVHKIPFSDGTFLVTSPSPSDAKTDIIDWDQSKVVASGQGPIYLNMDPNDPKYEEVRNKLMKDLEDLTCPETHARIAKKVYRREEVYWGEELNAAPDLLLEQGKGIHVSDGVGTNKIFAPPTKWRAENIRKGIFLAYGPEIKKGFEIEDINITDIAPTILYLMGLPVPSDMDGRVLKEIFFEDSKLSSNKVKYLKMREKWSEPRGKGKRYEEEFRNRLKKLGYL